MITAQDILDNDPLLRVKVDPYGSSLDAEKGIWYGQHVCVAEGFALDDEAPKKPGKGIIDHQLRVEHYSVLNFGFLVLHVGGFPHSTMCQLTRHQDSKHLVQSLRYTGQRFLDESLSIRENFYFRPLGTYQDRKGKRYEYLAQDEFEDMRYCEKACERYRTRISQGFSEEHARSYMPYEFRQNFAIAGTIEAVFHWLDQRSKKDSQLEIQALAILALQRLKETCPNLGQWYEENRFGKGRLAP